MRADWFLPVLRSSKPGVPERRSGILARAARRVFPAKCFSERTTKQRGWFRRFLRWMGPVWLAAPVRRSVQSICFVTFLWLFLVTCWPYSATPSRTWSGWIPADFDFENSSVLLVADATVEARLPLKTGQAVFVRDDSAGLSENSDAAMFRVLSVDNSEIRLELVRRTSSIGNSTSNIEGSVLNNPDLTFDVLSLSPGPWSIHETDPAAWPSHYADNLSRKEQVAAELFLTIDPLVSLSTGIASRSWVWSLSCAGIILAACFLVPRGFCGYLCPLGTLIDLFDWAIGKRVTRFRISGDGWWVHIKYYLLLGILVAAFGGVLLSGIFSAIPVITRGLLFTLSPLQTGAATGWHQLPPMNAGHVLSIALFFAVLSLGLLRPRFWCKYVCPSGAVFSLGNLFRATERKVESSCINCNKCIEICPFDAIKPDFTTRTTDCTFCQSCGGVCPTHAIKFVDRWEVSGLKIENDPPTNETALGRRGFLSASVGTASGVLGGLLAATGTKSFGANLDGDGPRPVRPPGSVPEAEFLQLCIRCGECFQSCPSDVLQPLGLQQGLEGLWTPHVNADWAGCASSCNACGQVCPTGAIRALPLEEKRHARMGLAIINESTCLPFHGEACQLCVDECTAAGYDALEFVQVGTEVNELGQPIEGTGQLAPLLVPDKCVGCGLCQTRCHGINVVAKSLLQKSAVIIEAGNDHEDRLRHGSYLQLREAEANTSEAEGTSSGTYLPAFLNDE
ncbi:MAG: 4Fe-4S binding protein [Rhodopirellula sp.]|nr:4Fe-4S binding protein [Rhodopirellula sp.]